MKQATKTKYIMGRWVTCIHKYHTNIMGTIQVTKGATPLCNICNRGNTYCTYSKQCHHLTMKLCNYPQCHLEHPTTKVTPEKEEKLKGWNQKLIKSTHYLLIGPSCYLRGYNPPLTLPEYLFVPQ